MAILPDEYAARMAALLGEEWRDFKDSFEGEKLCGLRVNTQKILPSELRQKIACVTEQVPWCAEGFYYEAEARPAKSVYYHAGLFYLQEPSAMAPAACADIKPGLKVLDMCAAPGGKSTQAAGYMQGAGVLVANDVSATRCKALIKNLELFGVTNAVVLCETPQRLAEHFGEYFDRVLIDAPCSGTGMFRKDSEAIRKWSAHKPQACAALQSEILYYGAKMLKPGGRIVYSTCTFEPDENEGCIHTFLCGCSDFSVAELNHTALQISPARPEWGKGRASLAGAARIWPHLQKGEGHFVCALQKAGAVLLEETEETERTKPKATRAFDDFYAFCKDVLCCPPPGDLWRHGISVYRTPDGLPTLDGLRVMRSGWYLGDLKTGRFEPSQAFAMGLKKEDVRRVITLPAEDLDVARYLRGESFVPKDDALEDGWYLVCIDTYPLGWAKAQGGRLKNKYKPSWMASG